MVHFSPFGRPSYRLLSSLAVWGFLLITTCFAGGANAAGTMVDSGAAISIAQGLPSDVVSAVYQTKDGYLWLGTEAGLARYDGVTLNTFRHKDTPGLADNLIRALFQDSRGVFWVGTQAGLSRYVAGRFERVEALGPVPVTGICEARDGSVWAATLGGGVWRAVNGVFAPVALDATVTKTTRFFRVFADSEDGVWIAPAEGGLIRCRGGLCLRPEWATANQIKDVNAMVQMADGSLFLATGRGLVRVLDGVVAPWGDQKRFVDEGVTDVLVDHDGELWVTSRGLFRSRTPTSGHFEEVLLHGARSVRRVLEDREGSLWVGTSGEGVLQLRETAFRLAYHAERGSESMRSVVVDQRGIVWMAVFGEGLVRLAPDGQVQVYPTPPGAESDVQSLLAARDGSIWCSTRGSTLCLVDGKLETLLGPKNVRTLYQDRQGDVWLGRNNGGVYRYREGAVESFAGKIGPAEDTPSAFAEAPDGALLVGFVKGGLVRWRRDQANAESIADGMVDNEVRCLHVDQAGLLWAGTKRRGLSILVDGRWRTADVLAETFSDLVTAVVEDKEGNVWIGTPRGLVWARRASVLAVVRGEAATFEFHRGLSGGASWAGRIGFGTQPNWARGPNGEFYFVSKTGLLAVQPAAIVANRTPPSVVIERLTVDGHIQDLGLAPVVPPGARSVVIDYTALSLVEPQRATFRYRLVGHDPDWVDAGTRRSAFYSNLAPGSYRFEVVAANEDGLRSDAAASIAFSQKPWPYQTWWFYALVVAVLAGMVAVFHRVRTADLRRVVDRQTEQIRQQMANEARLRAEIERSSRLESLGVLAGGIAHDFNNLLSAMLGNLGLIRLEPEAMELVGPRVIAAEKAIKRASDITKQLLTFAKGGNPVRSAVDLPDIVREAASFASHGSKSKVEFDFGENLPPADVDGGQISRVVHNLVLNAHQAMAGGGVVRVTLKHVTLADGAVATLPAGSYLKLAVTDQGPGFSPEGLTKVFDPYFTTKLGSSGLGLATVHSIVKKHQGHIEVESTPGHGATFRAWLPAAGTRPEPRTPTSAPPFPLPARATPMGKPRVLVMDDDELIRGVVGSLLGKLGYECTLVADGTAAVVAFEQARTDGRPYGVVVLDLTVPGGMGGKDTLEALRSMDPGVRAIAASGYSNDPVMSDHAAYGFAAVMPKPYTYERLVKTLEEVGRA